MADKINDVKSQEFYKFLDRQLRRLSYMWGPRNEALRAAKVSYGKYLCAECDTVFQKNQTHLDHIEPVVPLTGFISWDVHIERLFCARENFQVLCKPCHKKKTAEENAQRRRHKLMSD